MRPFTGPALTAVVALTAGGLAVASLPAQAAELVTAELVGTHNVVEVEQGKSADFTITLSATGNAGCGSTHTAKVKNAFAISAAGAVSTGSTFSEAVSFSAPGSGNGNCDIAGGGTVNARISAAAATPVDTYTVLLSEPADTTLVTSSNQQGGKLDDATATTLTFRVVRPANTAPTAGPAPSTATGVEGSTLTTSGAFSDVDGNLTAVEITSGAGVLVAARDAADKLTGAWTWSLATTDDVSGSVTVTARDAAGATATQTFTYAASNVAPRVVAAASSPSGNEGDTLLSGGRFEDVAGDPVTISKISGAGAVVDNRDGSWSWSLGTANETAGTVVVQATDGDGGTTQDSFAYSAANVAPGVRTAAADARGDEGTLLSTSGAFADVAADALTVAKQSGEGTVEGSASGSWTWSYRAGDDGTGTVRVAASDGTASGEDEFGWTVDNVAPIVTAGANPVSGAEGTTLTAGGSFTDPVDDLTISKVEGPGALTDNGDGTWSWSFDSTDDLNDIVVVEASDGDGGAVRDFLPVTVTNAAPTVATAASDATGSEGNTLAASGRFADVPADTVTVRKTDGPGTFLAGENGTWSWSLATSDQTSGTVTITATDGDGGETSDTFDYSAIDVAPQLVRAALDATGDEGQTLTMSGAFQDVATDDIAVVKVSGPGTVSDLGDGEWSYSLPTTDQVSGTVVVKAVDKDGVESVTDSFDVAAANVAPAVGAVPTNQAGSEGSTLSASGSFTDVPDDAISISKESGDGTVTDNGDGTWSWSLATTDNSSGTVVVEADDGDGGVTTTSFTFNASNVAPVLSSLTTTGATGTACQTGSTVRLRFTVADPGSADTMSGTISWGDGQTSTFTGRSVDTSHTYPAGVYTITVTVSDDDGAAAQAQTAGVNRNYAVGTIQSPYNADGSSVFKYGSTAPVKVRITDCNGSPVSGLSPTISITQRSSATPSTAVNEAVESTSGADTTGVLRFDALAGHYIYNLATRSLKDGDAQYMVTVTSSGSSVSRAFGVRTR